MNSLRWRLSFSQNKSSRPLKIVWQEFSQSYGQNAIWTIQRRKSIVNLLDIIENAIDQGAIADWQSEFDHSGFDFIKHLLESAILASREDFHGAVEESTLTTNELISRLLFVANHGLSSYCTSPNLLVEELEKNPVLIWNALELLQIYSNSSSGLAIELVRLLRICICSIGLAKSFVIRNGCNIVVDAVLSQVVQGNVSCVHPVVSFMTNVIGNARFADILSASTVSQANANSGSNSLYGLSRPRASSASSTGSHTQSRSSMGNISSTNLALQQQSRTTDSTMNHPAMFAHLDGVDSYRGEANESAWGIFAEMIRLTPFGLGSNLWSTVADNRTFEFEDKHIRNGLGPQIALDEAEHQGLPKHRVSPDLASDDILAEKARLDDYFEHSQNILPSSQSIVVSLDTIGSNVITSANQFLMVASQQAITAVEAVNVLVFFLLCVVDRNENKTALMTQRLMLEIETMLVRVDEGLDLLGSCREQSLAMAKGSSGQNRSSPSKKTGNVDKEDSSVLFHMKIVSILLKLVYDCVQLVVRDVETLVLNDMHTYIWVLNLVKCLYITGRQRLQNISLQFILSFQRLSPIIAVAIDKCGLQTEMLRFIAKIVNTAPDTYRDIDTMPWANFHSTLLALKHQAIALRVDNQDISAMFAGLLLRKWFPSYNLPEAQRAFRCYNCESEVAQFECLGESCFRENCHLLCVECDKVFHKSSSKRAHIRLNCLRCYFCKDQPSTLDVDNCIPSYDAQIQSSMNQTLYPVLNDVIFDRGPSVASSFSRELVSACLFSVISDIFLESSNGEYQSAIPLHISISMLLLRRLTALPLSNITMNIELEASISSAVNECRFLLRTDPYFNSVTQGSSGPPSKWQRSPRRLLHNMLVRFFSSCMLYHNVPCQTGDLTEYLRLHGVLHGVKSIFHSGVHAEESILCDILRHGFHWQMDAILMHFFVGDSSQTHLGNSERQAAIWLLRELYQAGCDVKDPQLTTKSVACWISWCMRAALSPSMTSTKYPIIVPPELRIVLPLGSSPISKQTLLFLLQELCVLFGGFSQVLDHRRLDTIILETDVHNSRVDSKDSNNNQGTTIETPRSLTSTNVNIKRHGVMFTLCHDQRRLVSDFLTTTDFLCLLITTAFGDLVDLVDRFPVSTLEKSFLKFAKGIISASEYEQDVFCLSIQLLGEIVALHPHARAIIDQVLCFRVFTMMLQGLSEAFDILTSSERVTISLAKLTLHCCLTGSLCFHPIIPFDRTIIGMTKTSTELMFPPRVVAQKRFEHQQPQKTSLRLTVAMDTSQPVESIEDNLSLLLSLGYYLFDEVRLLSCMMRGVFLHTGDGFSLEELQSFLISFDFAQLASSEKRLGKQGNRSQLSDDIVEDVGTPRSNAPRRSSRRLITSASNASFDAGDVTSRWEVESLGRSSAAYGDLVSRGSLGSNQSVVAIMQALKAMPIEAVLQLPECGTVLNGFSEPLSPHISAPALTKENLIGRQKTSQSTKPHDAEDSLDHVSDLLVSLSGQLYSVAPVLVVLHQCLVQRSGLTSWLEDMDHESISDHPTSSFAMSTAEEHYYTLLKRHLSFIFLTRSEHITPLRGDFPIWNEIMFRNEEGMEHLLAVSLIFGDRVHNVSRDTLDQILLGNPSCLHTLASSASTLLILHRMAASNSHMADYALKLLVQALSHSIDDVMLRYLIDTARVGSHHESLQAFFVMEKVLELRQPRSFLNFMCRSPTKLSSLKLRPVPNVASGIANKGFSVAMWLKLNCLEHGCVGNLFHCNVGDILFFQVFLRSLYNVKDSSHRRKFQLCLRLGTRAVDSSSGNTNIGNLASNISQKTSELEQQIWTLSTDALAGYFLPDYVSILEDISESEWALFQLHYNGGKFTVSIGNRVVSLQRFSPQGYSISSSISPPEKQFIASMERQLEKANPTFVFGSDCLLDKIMTIHTELFDGISAKNINEEVISLPMEINEIFCAVRKVSRCMGMSISDILVSDIPPSTDIQRQWLSNGAYGGLPVPQLGGMQSIASLTQQDLFNYASCHQDKSCSQVCILGSQNAEPQSAGRTFGSNKIGSTQSLQQELMLSKDVSVYCEQHLQQALKHLGGFRVIFPLLLTGDSSKTNATMELLLRCVHLDVDFESFVGDKLDAALIYAFTLMNSANASGAIPLLFNWVRFPFLDEIIGDDFAQGHITNDAQARPEIIGWISDTICSLVGNLQAGLHWTQWSKDSVLDVPHRSSLLMKHVSPLSMLSLGCLWVFDDWNIEQCNPLQQEERNKHTLPRSTMSTPHFMSTSSQSNGMLDAVCNAYLLQTQTFRLLRLTLLQQTLSTSSSSSSNAASSSTMRTLVQTLQQLLMTALFCARRSASESLGMQRDRRSERENGRKLERLKVKLRATASTTALLKQGDCFTSSYWHASAAVHLLRLVHDVLLRDLSLVRSLGGALLSQVAVELFAHSVPELRAKAIVLAMLSASTPEAQIDAKRISDMEKSHFFELLNEQLTAARDPCDENVLDALQNFLFWRLRLDEDTQYAYFCSVNGNTSHQPGHGNQRGRSLVEDIAVPQCLGALFRILHHARHWDILKMQLSSLIDFNLGGRTAHSLDSISDANMEKLLLRKDWIWDVADLILAHQRKLQVQIGASEEDVSGVFSLSESESLGGISFGSSSHYLSGADSDDASSVATIDDGQQSHNANSNSPDSTKLASSFDHTALRTDFVSRFSGPVKSFLVFLITCEFMKRPGVVRKWSDLFRLALPETSRLLEEILVMVLQDVGNVTVVQQECEAGVNYLSNIGAFIEMALEKAPVSLSFSVFAVQSLQTLSYRCCQELRLKAAKDVQLREVRNSLLFRCLADTGQELQLRLSAVLELTVPLQAYVLQPEHKVLAESVVCFLLLGLWIDVFDELQSNAFHQQQIKTSQTNISLSASSADAEWLRTSLDCMSLLAGLIKSLVVVSTESQRLLGRLFESLVHDEEKVLGGYFLPNKTPSSSSGSSNVIKITRSSFGSSRDILTAATGQGSANTITQLGNPTNSSVSSNNQNIVSSAPVTAPVVASGSSWWLGWSLGSTSSAPTSNITNTGDAAPVSNVGQIVDAVSTVDKTAVVSGNTSVIMTEETDQAQRNPSDMKIGKPIDDMSLVLWFCRSELRELHVELRLKLGKELRLALRTTDKMREKTSQRLLRHVKSLQDKRSRERLLQAKIVADGLQTTRTLLDKTQSQFLRELQAWQRTLRERIHHGRDVFRTLDIQLVPSSASSVLSPSRIGINKSSGELHMDSFTPVSSDPSTVSSAAAGILTAAAVDVTTAVLSEEQRRLRAMQSFQLPAALVDYLSEQPQQPHYNPPLPPCPTPNTGGSDNHNNNHINTNNNNCKLRPTEALHAMLECFGSAKRIVLLLD